MKIAFILDRFPQNGGVENITIQLSNEFFTHGLDVIIISKLGTKNELLANLNPEVKLYTFPDENFSPKLIAEILNRENVQIVLNQGAYPQMNKTVLRIKKIIQIPIISILHNDPLYIYKYAVSSISKCNYKGVIKQIFKIPYLYFIKKTSQKNFRCMAKASDIIVLLSKTYIADFIHILNPQKPFTENIFYAIPNFVNEKYSQQYEKTKSILFVGRLEESQKKLSRLFAIWHNLFYKYPDWKLEIVGDGPDYEKYQAYVKSHKIGNVIFHGFSDKTDVFYKRASIIALTSEFEGFPLTLLEGMKYGCVPIAYNSFKAINDIIDNGNNGFIVEPFSETAFSECIEKLILNNALLNSMASKSIVKCRQYSTEKIVNEWISVFKTLLAGDTSTKQYSK